jgi:hypothetical protein
VIDPVAHVSPDYAQYRQTETAAAEYQLSLQASVRLFAGVPMGSRCNRMCGQAAEAVDSGGRPFCRSITHVLPCSSRLVYSTA